eukprot:CAMPEP_0180522972 /NCGR_PEP_ID=MMETSP1036_2-20121128/57734_1 /TAXON_ID=632150 /ORGANISM="Azadinium spinosum, Strain 3D9" /LENGTH=71 /DNA_ID=CAMNT_0022535869 /DNA_START=128 /DNA_END=339 /DNA_ORIENTATION=-
MDLFVLSGVEQNLTVTLIVIAVYFFVENICLGIFQISYKRKRIYQAKCDTILQEGEFEAESVYQDLNANLG